MGSLRFAARQRHAVNPCWRRRGASLALAAGVLMAAFLVAFGPPALGREVAAQPSVDPVVEARLMAIPSELRCLVGHNRTLADADADANLAIALRAPMRALLPGALRDLDTQAGMAAPHPSLP